MGLKAHDLETLPIFRGFGLWYFGTEVNAATFSSLGWEIANGNASANSPSYTRPNQRTGRYIKGGASVTTVDAGAATHYHTINDHTHNVPATGAARSPGGESTGSMCYPNHTHTLNGTGSASNLAIVSNDPYRIEPIPMVYCLTAGGTGKGLPRIHDLAAECFDLFQNAIGWTEESSFPSEYALCDGNNGAPNLVGKFIRGVRAGGADGVVGAAYTNTHTHTTSHDHGTTGACTVGWGRYNVGTGSNSQTHTHSTDAASVTSNAVTGTVEPLNRSLKFVMYKGHSVSGPLRSHDLDTSIARIPAGLSAAKHTDGAPTNWTAQSVDGAILYHGTGNYQTGGSKTHTHSGNTHNHGNSTAVSSGFNPYNDGEDTSEGSHITHVHSSGNAANWSVGTGDSTPASINLLWVMRGA